MGCVFRRIQKHLIIPSKENDPEYVCAALAKGYHVEVDVWYEKGSFYLGHDEATYPIDEEYLEDKRIFAHAKNIEAFHAMLENSGIDCFWHENDLCTLTSQGYVWKYPEVYFEGNLWGVCSDWL